MEAGVRGGKDCLRYDNNNPEHPKPSCDDPDECAGDNGGKDRNKTAKQIQHLLACLAGTDLLVGAVSSQDERFISDSIGLFTVFGAILTGRQSGQKLQYFHASPVPNKFLQN